MDRIKGFDGLRALALIAVFLQHYTTLGRELSTGGYGVWLFFALSGFLIVRILVGERRRIEAGAISWGAALRRFFWRRTLRIWPIYYLLLILFTVLAALQWVTDFTWPAAAWHYAYLSNIYFGEVAGRWVGRFGYFWSLAIEEQFYILAAPALLLAPSGWARGICAGVVLAALACDIVLRTSGASEMALYTNSLTNFGALAFGGWVGLGLPAKARNGVRSWPGVACIGLVIAWIVAFPHMGLWRPATATLLAMTPLWVATLLSVGLLAGVFLNQDSRLVRGLEWAPIRYFGRISYGFYLYHAALPHWMIFEATRQAGFAWRAPEAVEALFAFVVALGLAALSWTLIERPLLRLKDRPPSLARLRAGLRSLVPANG